MKFERWFCAGLTSAYSSDLGPKIEALVVVPIPMPPPQSGRNLRYSGRFGLRVAA